jgi:RHS repeat-associated protein
LRQKTGTGSDAVLEGYVATGDAAFGAAFASTTSGTWATQADRLQFGTTTSVALDGVFDNVRLDVGSMPPAGAAPGGVVLARAPHAPRVLGDAPVIAARALLFTPPSGQTWRSYYYAGSQRIAVRVEGDPTPANNGLFYLLSDHLGSTSVTTDASANKVAELRYYPYGQTRYSWNNTPTSHRFTGQVSDDSTGLYFYGARYYDPYLNRWIQPDSIVPEAGNPQALNRYSFVANNPIKYIDPSGHCWGFASGLRNTGFYGATCNNIDMALTIVQSPDASVGDKAFAGGYILVEGVAHGALALGVAGLACSAVAPCLTAAESALGIGAAACADGDCTNEANVARQAAQSLRQAYETEVRGLTPEVSKRFSLGQLVEEIARWAHAARRALGEQYKNMTPPDMLEKIYARNLAKYGDKLGPSIEYLLSKGKTWEEIIESALTPGGQDIIPQLLQSGR